MKTIYRIGLSITVLMMVGILVGCNNTGNNSPKVGQERMVETSRKDKPQWVEERPKQDDQNIYFVGQSESGSSAGVRDARQIAISQFSQFVSNTAKSIYEGTSISSSREASKSRGEEFIRNVANNTVRGAVEKESYWEKIEVTKPEGVNYYYRVYSLISVPVKSIETSLMSENNAESEQKDKISLDQVRAKLSAELDKLDKK